MRKIPPANEAAIYHDAPIAEDAAAAALPRGAALAAAGDDDRIPRVFLGSMDLAALALAFLAAYAVAPAVQRSLLPGGVLDGLLPEIFPVPSSPTPAFPPISELVWLLVVSAPATLVVMELIGGYRRLLDQSVARLISSAALSQTIAISFSALLVFALKLSSSSRVLIFTYGLLAAVGLLSHRASVRWYQQRRLAEGAYARNVLLVGQTRAVEWLVRHVQDAVPHNRFRLLGWLDVPGEPIRTAPERRKGDASREIPLPRLGGASDLGDLLVNRPIHEVIAIQSSGRRDWLRRVIEHCDYFRIRLRVVPEALLFDTLTKLRLGFSGDLLHLPEVALTPPYLDEDVLFVKRFIDIVASAALLIVLAPLLLLIAVAIKLTTPALPALYPWRVIGLSGRPFTGYKFTTMVADADDQKPSLLPLNEMEGPVFKLQNDPRITALGRILRKFSLNELPQLWSVLKGDMSLVGLRPAFPDELRHYEMWQKRKLCVKPGMTCLWQVSGRNRIANFDDWVRLDLEYIDRWSLGLDMRILARTVWAVVSGAGS